MSDAALYRHRFDVRDRARKRAVWQVLCRHFFQRYVGPEDTVLDLGAGFCEFINHIVCRRRIAVDVSEDLPRHAGPGVEVLVAPCTDLAGVAAGSVDVVFASNVLEHLPSKPAVLQTLREARRVLRTGGRLLVLQPNARIVGGAHWDFFDHHVPLTERSLAEACLLAGLRPTEIRARFLPYTTKSGLPQHPFLVWLYLKVPLAHRLLGGQAWVVAEKPPDPTDPG